MPMFTRQLADQLQLKSEVVHVAAWGCDVMIKELTGSERDSYEASIVGNKRDSKTIDLTDVRARLVARCIVDPETGKRLYADNEAAIVGKLPAAGLDVVYDRCKALSGISKQDEDELIKNANFTDGQLNASGTD